MISIRPTPKANRQKLETELKALMNASVVEQSGDDPAPPIWQLCERGDALHLVHFVPDPAAADQLEAQIMEVANTMNHHPHISKDDMSSGCQMLISCTHSPLPMLLLQRLQDLP